ncbi:uncharacterized protein CBL_01839 [Carabus blaptoides fortunei]
MIFVQIFVTLLLCATVLSGPALPDENSKGNLTRIIDGSISTKTNYYEVAIIADNVSPGLICAGAILNSRWILTSAFCAERNSNLRIEYGKNTIAGNGNVGQLVYRKFIHPSFNRATLTNDIALLEMNPPLPGDAPITQVVLPTNVLDNYIGQTGTISGWGATTEYGLFSIFLNSKPVTIFHNDYCQRDGNYMIPYKLCTGGRAVCEGDQGAPLVIGNTLVAVRQIQCAADVQSRVVGQPASRKFYEIAVLTPQEKICTASLIDPFWAVTSASCASRSSRLRIQPGDDPKIYAEGEYIKDIYIHPGFNKLTLINDIALIQLATAASKDATMLDIPNLTEIFFTAVVSGYGAKDADRKLKEESVTILDTATCNKFTPMNAYKLCTFLSTACERDQGGPLVSDGKLVGIISVDDFQTLVCGDQTVQPITTYTRVAPYKSWIKSITKLNYL